MNAQPMPAVPLLALDHACVAEARRALAADQTIPEPHDDAVVVTLLLVARALPVALDALDATADAPARVRLLAPLVDGLVEPSRAALHAVALVDVRGGRVEVRVGGGARSAELVESDAHVLCRVVFPFVADENEAENETDDQDEDSGVRLQRFGHGPTNQR